MGIRILFDMYRDKGNYLFRGVSPKKKKSRRDALASHDDLITSGLIDYIKGGSDNCPFGLV